jgi:hypothetical protein
MANILCLWEMGSALGHLANLKPFIDGAIAAGHKVSLAAKELQNVEAILGRRDIALYQSPYLTRPVRQPYPRLISYPQLVLQRFETSEELTLLTRAWDAIFAAVNPDLVIYDFAYSALVASYGKPWRKWLVGNGFMMPRVQGGLLGVFPGVANNAENLCLLEEAEQRLLKTVNTVLAGRDTPVVTVVGDIVNQAEYQLLLTLPGLDQFGERSDGRYLGLPNLQVGHEPVWPQEGKLKVFAYLSQFGLLNEVLDNLFQHDLSLLVYCRDDVTALQKRYPGVHFVNEPVDLALLNQQADLVVSMANHGTCAMSYLHGVPQLMIPRRQEQFYMAVRIAQAGRGVVMLQDDPESTAKIGAAVAIARNGRLPVDQSLIDEMSGGRLERFITEHLSRL